MHRGYQYLSSLLLAAAFATPVAMKAAASPQDDSHHEDRQRDDKRYYDKHHKDYHNWDANEDRSYQRYRTEHHEKRDFVQLNTHQQAAYWNWRHNNPDR